MWPQISWGQATLLHWHITVSATGCRSEISQQAFERRLAPLADYELTHQLEKITERPLLVWHGEADDVVPAAESARLVQALRTRGGDNNLTYLTEAGIGHKITPTALRAGSDFFTQYL